MLALLAECICIMFVTGGTPSSASWRSATLGYTFAALTTAMVIAAVFAQPQSILARVVMEAVGSVGAHILWHLPLSPRDSLGGSSLPSPQCVVFCRVADPRLGLALSLSQASVVPVSGALSRVTASIESEPFARFAIALLLVLAFTTAAAALHYHYVERRFTKTMKA
jgi:hypothetical protein